MQGQIMARFAINSGQIIRLFPSRTEPLLGALVALDEVRSSVFYTSLSFFIYISQFFLKELCSQHPKQVTFTNLLFSLRITGIRCIYLEPTSNGNQRCLSNQACDAKEARIMGNFREQALLHPARHQNSLLYVFLITFQ
jgi:hypothetical protein